ncbi:MAG: S8 family serine peptidase [Lachnospiraceae bacterium]|nr:S8 family serine peptidase [Lachnospiraceae bacterium]
MYYKIKRWKPIYLLLSVFLLSLCSGTLTKVRAEETSEAELSSFLYPNDPYNDTLWAYDNPGFYTHYYGTFPVTRYTTENIDLNLWEAWEAYPLSKEDTRTVVIAIIDTGVDYRHPDLQDQMWVNTNEIPDNGIDDDGNGYIDDIHGWDFYNNDASVCHYTETPNGYTANPDDNDNHGTHIAGIIAATANNNLGISGVASNVNVQIMSLKIHGGSTSSGSVANAIKAIRYAEAMGADICNLSWGTTNYNQALELTIRESSMLFITAAGNHGIDNNATPMYPASLRLPNLISVAYINSDGELDPSSNYGVSTVDIAAPGQDIYSTLVGSFGYSSGSSMAAPHVTGLAAMIYAYRDNIYPSQVKELIINSLTLLDSLDGSLIHPGIPNACEAIRSLSELQIDIAEPFLMIDTSYSKDAITLTIDAYDVGTSGIRKVHYAYGSKPAEFFSTTSSTAVLNNTVSLSKAGYYTFYVEDYAGNYSLYNYYVEDDTLVPDFKASYQVAPDYSGITISASVSDSGSGLKAVKYLVGEYSKEAFLFAGESLDPALEQHTLTVAPDISAVTFYATDYRGNSSVYIVYTRIIPATALHLNITERSLHLMDTFQLQPLIFPWLSTDGVSYTSYNNSVAVVDSQGLVTAIGSGEAYIQVETHSGVFAFCRFIVTE